MYTDLIAGGALIAIAAVGWMWAMRWIDALPERRRRTAALRRMSGTQLNVQLTRCAGAIMNCARRRDCARQLRNIHRCQRAVERELKRRSRARETKGKD